jgi:hypothetical protein
MESTEETRYNERADTAILDIPSSLEEVNLSIYIRKGL